MKIESVRRRRFWRAGMVAALARKPVVIGHSFGALLAQILAGRGLAAVSVAIDPAPFRGVLPCRSPRCGQHQRRWATRLTGTARCR